MFHQNDYDLSRQKYHEYNEQFEGMYAPLQDKAPGVIQRLLAALSKPAAKRAPAPAIGSRAARRHAGGVAK